MRLSRCIGAMLVLLQGCLGHLPLPPGSSAGVEITGVPIVSAREYHCGPAALAMVAGFHGYQVSSDRIAEIAYLPGRRGSLREDIIGAGRRLGLLPYVLEPDLAALLHELESGHPVIVLQNRGLSFVPLWHYAVVIGFARSPDRLLLRSGASAAEELSVSTFLATWERADSWALVVLPPGRLPATARPDRVLGAASGLERSGRFYEAAEVYRSAQLRWPGEPAFPLGRANSLLRAGARSEALAVLAEAIKIHPESAVLLNNLAHLLAEEGKHHEALPYAQRAASLPGPFQEACRNTLRSILDATAAHEQHDRRQE